MGPVEMTFVVILAILIVALVLNHYFKHVNVPCCLSLRISPAEKKTKSKHFDVSKLPDPGPLQ